MKTPAWIKPLGSSLLLSMAFVGCGDPPPVVEDFQIADLVGEPIIEKKKPSKEAFENKSADMIRKQDAPVSAKPNKTEDENQSLVAEGIVAKGRVIEEEANASFMDQRDLLPPLKKGSPYRQLAFRDLTDFEYEVDWEKDGREFQFAAYAERVPKKLRELSNAKVAIEGFMIPTVVDENNEVKEFLLLPDQMSCCFGQAPEANGWVVVSSDEGVEVMMDRMIRVTGLLTVEERWDEEFFVGLYHMQCSEITGPSP